MNIGTNESRDTVMGDKHLTSAFPGKSALESNLAYQIAREKLLDSGDIGKLCRNSGAKFVEEGAGKAIIIEYLNRPYTLLLPQVEIAVNEEITALSIREKLLILHYLITARGTPSANKLITFLDLPEGKVYYPTFLKRAVQPLVNKFGGNPGLLQLSAKQFGGRQAGYGDASVIIDAFPRVPVTMVIWGNDEEFAAQGNVLFDAGIIDYLPTEDITILCETIAWKLVKS